MPNTFLALSVPKIYHSERTIFPNTMAADDLAPALQGVNDQDIGYDG